MSMSRLPGKSGLSLVLVGLQGMLFFWISDPRWGWGSRWIHPDNPIDAVNQQFPGTVAGFVGCLAIFLIGWYLLSRKTV